jgi:hypothetical protein
MGRRQKGKHMKRSRSWHHRFAGPDRALRSATKRLDAALAAWQRARTEPNKEGTSR